MDIKNLYTAVPHEEGAEIQITNPLDGKPTDFYIHVKGIDSKSYREAVKKYHRKLINNEEGGDIDLLVSLTAGWKGLKSGKEEVEFTPQTAHDLYTNSPGICSQIDKFVADRKNFMKG